MIKHFHITLAVLSVALFTLRFYWTISQSEMCQKKWVKISPHIIDTFLLIFGITLAVKLAINPMDNTWLLEKIIALIAYIFTGYYTLKMARNRIMQIFGFLGAIGWLMLIVRIAMTKESVFL